MSAGSAAAGLGDSLFRRFQTATFGRDSLSMGCPAVAELGDLPLVADAPGKRPRRRTTLLYQLS